MTRRRLIALLLVLFNIPWVCLWWYFSNPALDRRFSLLALYMLLMLCTIGMVILPLFLGGLQGKRWLLILVLGINNIYWGLEWIGLLSEKIPRESGYAAVRAEILRMMGISSVIVLLIYWTIDRMLHLGRLRDRRPR